jgi:hypothetical protein
MKIDARGGGGYTRRRPISVDGFKSELAPSHSVVADKVCTKAFVIISVDYFAGTASILTLEFV